MDPLTGRVLGLARTEILKDEPDLLSTIDFIESDLDELSTYRGKVRLQRPDYTIMDEGSARLSGLG
jgi:hypothetical protein